MVLFRYVVYHAIGTTGGDGPEPLGETLLRMGRDLLEHLLIAAGMAVLIQPARRLAPPQGVWRVVLVSVAVLAAAVLASAVRMLLFQWQNPQADDGPLWRSTLHLLPRFLALAALLVAVAEFHRAQVRSLEAMRAADADRAALEQQTLQARLRTLEAQVEPHFLFNVLANVRRLYDTDVDAGEAMLGRLMHYLQVALPSMRDAHSTLDRELQLAESYLELQQVRMGHRLQFGLDVEPTLRGLAVPPMMLLTLVENAIKHGLAPLREGGRIELRAWQGGGRLCVEVADTGRGFGHDTAGGGTGLANIRARLAALYGAAGELQLMPRQPRGLVARLHLPMATATATATTMPMPAAEPVA